MEGMEVKGSPDILGLGKKSLPLFLLSLTISLATSSQFHSISQSHDLHALTRRVHYIVIPDSLGKIRSIMSHIFP